MIRILFQNGERLIGLLLLALGMAVAAGALMTMPIEADGIPGAGFFPIVVGVALAVCAAVMIARPTVPPAASEPRVTLFVPAVLATVLFLAALAVAFERVPAVVTLFVLLTGLSWIYGRMAWWKSVLFGLSGAIVAWVLFVRLLAVPLPGF